MNKKIGGLGMIIILANFIYNIYDILQSNEIMNELVISITNNIILFFPVFLLFFINKFKKGTSLLAFTYLGVLIAGLIYLYAISTGPLAGGLVMLGVEGLALVIGIILLILKK